MESVTFVTTPSAPRPTTAPINAASALDKFITSPAAFTNSIATIPVERLPLFTPLPCVAVATEPAIVMCGSDARLCNAYPF